MLVRSDFASSTWKRTEAELRARLQSLRETNDGPHDSIRTAEIRGSISEVKRLLSLAKASDESEAGPGNGAWQPAE